MGNKKANEGYRGIISLDSWGGYVFNNGSNPERTKTHMKNCKEAGFDYKVIDTINRTFDGGKNIIAPYYDSEYVKRVADRLNKTVLKDSKVKAELLKDWVNKLDAKKQINQPIINIFSNSKTLSYTECIFVPSQVSTEELLEACKYVDNSWYFKDKSLRIKATHEKEYKDTTTNEKKNVAKPISKAFHKKIINAIINAIKHKTSEAKLLSMKLIRVQSIELAYTLSCLSLFKNAKFRVLLTADDIEKHLETYNAIKNNPRFEFIECSSDIKLIGELLDMSIKPDLDIINPPYDGSLHLEILSKVIANKKPGATIVSVQPVRWIEDPLAEYKQGSDYKKYKVNIVDKLSQLNLIEANTACKFFNIMNGTDLGIFVFNDSAKETLNFNLQINLIEKLKIKIASMPKLNDYLEKNKVEGFRCEVKEIAAGTGGHNLGNYDSSKIADVHIVWGPYIDGYDKDNKFFTETRQKNQFTKKYFANSISFDTFELANNFNNSCNTKFYYNLIQLFKWDVNVPLKYLPYMKDYSHAWTDEDYCKYFELTEEESKFMCREVEDYRIKDFINYLNLNED